MVISSKRTYNSVYRHTVRTLLNPPLSPDPWLDHQNPWEIPRLDVTVDVRFGGHAEKLENGRGIWSGGQEVLAVAYDVPIPGKNCNICSSSGH